jgi:formate C-acetyltransferase
MNLISLEKLRMKLVEKTPKICVERALIYTAIYKEYENYPVIVKRAIALKRTLEQMTVYINDEDVLAGNQASEMRSAPVFPEYSIDWIVNELDQFSQRPSDQFEISSDNKAAIREIYDYWKGKTVLARVETMQPQLVKDATEVGVMEWQGNVSSGEGHLSVDYPALLKYGIKGMQAIINGYDHALEMTEPNSIKKKTFYEASRIALEGFSSYCNRYGELAEEQASSAEGPRREELNQIAVSCKWIAVNPPRTFFEALQLVLLAHIVLQIESSGHSVSIGRIDQYLYPFYRKDKEEGLIHPEDAEILIAYFNLKLFSVIKLRPWSHTRYLSGHPTFQNVCVGGQNEDGTDAVNELTYLFLNSLKHTRLSEPNFYVRYHKGIDKKFFDTCLEVVALGFGMPALVNDEVIIPSLEMRGVKKEDAIGYATVGCLEVSVPGKWGYRCNGKSKFNLLKVLELAINNGYDRRTKQTLFPITGEFNSFEDVKSAWVDQVKQYTHLHVIADNINSVAIEELVPDAFCSALVNDCIPRGKALNEGGAVYDIQSGAQIGVANVGNALAAIKKLVFEDKKLSFSELRDTLDTNFEAEDGGIIRKKLINDAPKYGNDEDYVDLLAKEAYDVYCHEVEKYKNTRYGRGPIGGGWMPSTVTISANVPGGLKVGATPDGRYDGTPTADGVSPMHGTEFKGLTAVLNSVSKLSTILMTGGQLLNIRLLNNMLRSAGLRDKLGSLLETFFEMDGWHVQINCISNEVLRAAQENPEEYRDLTVRVAGYSALFVTLDPMLQEDIMKRSEHQL